VLKCKKKLILPADEISLAWKIYTDCFSGQELTCVQNQVCFNKDNFIQAMKDKEWIKFMLYSDDTLIGLSVTTKNLEKGRIGYINPEFLITKYPKYVGKIYYTLIICVMPSYKKTKGILWLITNLLNHITNDGGMVFCDFNYNKNRHLPGLIISIMNKIKETKRRYTSDIIDSQMYVAIKSEL